ncbi:MAG: TauD/TfdA family dioxygenase [Rhizobiales bacterium]|nr:TauD/TfdA family dioxygenase [Hyphomicrobiales bacterium]
MSETVTGVPKQKVSAAPLNEEIGAEITGIDLSLPLDDETFAEIQDAFFKHSVLVFREQNITAEQQIAFSRRFGDLEIHVLKQFLHPQHPEILLISNIVEQGQNIGLADAGRYWHSDLCYKPAPSMGSLLYAVEVPHDDEGRPLGDTLFASVASSYDALPDDLKTRAAGLRALHSLEHTFDRDRKDVDVRTEEQAPGADQGITRTKVSAEQKKVAEAVHPVVRTHPVTGRKCLYVNDSTAVKIVDIPNEESEQLLGELRARCIRPDFVYRHKWQVGDLVMWDNCASQHQAVADYELPQRRRMHRTTVSGTVPF